MEIILPKRKAKNHTGKKLSKFLDLIRFNNLMIICISQLLLQIFVINNRIGNFYPFYDHHFISLLLSSMLVAAGGYIINDYFDTKIDAINKPYKLVVGKYISRRCALLWHTLLTISGIALAFYNGLSMGFLHVLSAFVLWLYSRKLKQIAFAGNLSIAFLSALSVMIVSFLYRTSYGDIFMYALLAFYITLIRELIKDIEDIKGDSSFGCKTLPIVWGVRNTVKLVSVLVVMLIVNLFVFFPDFSFVMIVYFSALVTLPLTYIYLRLNKADTIKDFRKLSLYCKLIMISGMGSVVVFGL